MSLLPGQKIKPPFTVNDAVAFTESNYNLNIKNVKEMNSYDDRNYLITTENDERFTLKVSNSLDSSVPLLIDTMNELLLFVHNQGVAVPVPMLTKNSDVDPISVTYAQLNPSTADRYAILLLAFIDGKLLVEIDFTPQVLENVGLALAKLDTALCAFDNRVLKQRSLTWSLLSVPILKGFVFAIDDLKRRKLVEAIIEDFETTVLSNIQKFKSVLIHGDFNEQNILVRQTNNGEHTVCGVLDFGDTHYAPQIFDLAILCVYAMLECKTMDFVNAPQFVIKGYKQKIDITDQDWQILPTCVLARLAQSLTLGAYSYKSEPTNEYLLATARTGWTVLERLHVIEKRDLIKLWQ